MSLTPNTRRSFIGNLTVLSTGLVFGSMCDFVFEKSDKLNLTLLWKRICENSGALSINFSEPLNNPVLKNPCIGHRVKAGVIANFSDLNLLAQPAWIYWKNENNVPNDMVVSFFSADDITRRLFTLNRFELEMTDEMMKRGEKFDSIANNFTGLKNAMETKRPKNSFLAKTTITKSNKAKSFFSISDHHIQIDNTLI